VAKQQHEVFLHLLEAFRISEWLSKRISLNRQVDDKTTIQAAFAFNVNFPAQALDTLLNRTHADALTGSRRDNGSCRNSLPKNELLQDCGIVQIIRSMAKLRCFLTNFVGVNSSAIIFNNKSHP
jgi:hypothetical protein